MKEISRDLIDFSTDFVLKIFLKKCKYDFDKKHVSK